MAEVGYLVMEFSPSHPMPKSPLLDIQGLEAINLPTMEIYLTGLLDWGNIPCCQFQFPNSSSLRMASVITAD
jgi:hypothetical protein